MCCSYFIMTVLNSLIWLFLFARSSEDLKLEYSSISHSVCVISLSLDVYILLQTKQTNPAETSSALSSFCMLIYSPPILVSFSTSCCILLYYFWVNSQMGIRYIISRIIFWSRIKCYSVLNQLMRLMCQIDYYNM